MQINKVQEQFSKRAETYNISANWITSRELHDAHTELAGKPYGKALECCCGTCEVGKAFHAKGWQINGIDITQEMMQAGGPGYQVIQGSVENMPFADNSYDLVVLRQALFLFDSMAGLKEIRRVLKPGGSFILSQTVPFSEADEPWLKHIHQAKQAQLLNFFTRADLERMLLAAGFNINETKTLSVRENITHWMKYAPEQSNEKKQEICDLVSNSPEEYHKTRNVEVINNEVFEDWFWVIFKCS